MSTLLWQKNKEAIRKSIIQNAGSLFNDPYSIDVPINGEGGVYRATVYDTPMVDKSHKIDMRELNNSKNFIEWDSHKDHPYMLKKGDGPTEVGFKKPIAIDTEVGFKKPIARDTEVGFKKPIARDTELGFDKQVGFGRPIARDEKNLDSHAFDSTAVLKKPIQQSPSPASSSPSYLAQQALYPKNMEGSHPAGSSGSSGRGSMADPSHNNPFESIPEKQMERIEAVGDERLKRRDAQIVKPGPTRADPVMVPPGEGWDYLKDYTEMPYDPQNAPTRFDINSLPEPKKLTEEQERNAQEFGAKDVTRLSKDQMDSLTDAYRKISGNKPSTFDNEEKSRLIAENEKRISGKRDWENKMEETGRQHVANAAKAAKEKEENAQKSAEGLAVLDRMEAMHDKYGSDKVQDIYGKHGTGAVEALRDRGTGGLEQYIKNKESANKSLGFSIFIRNN